MEVLLWLVPPVVVTTLAALGVSWWERRAQRRDRAAASVDRAAAARRLGEALERPAPGYAAPRRPAERPTVAVRRDRRSA